MTFECFKKPQDFMRILQLMLFFVVTSLSQLHAATDIQFPCDHTINNLDIIHEDTDAIIIYDVDAMIQLPKVAMRYRHYNESIWADVQLILKSQKGLPVATIEHIVKDVQLNSKFNLRGK